MGNDQRRKGAKQKQEVKREGDGKESMMRKKRKMEDNKNGQ